MKKLLALILAVIMALSIMPMAYAKRAEYSPEIEEYIDNIIRFFSYRNYNIYESGGQYDEFLDMLDEFVQNSNLIEPSYDSFISIDDEQLDEIIALNESFNKVYDEINKKIADNELVCVIDSYELCKYYVPLAFDFYYSYEHKKEVEDRAETLASDKFIAALDEFENGKNRMDEACTQADFDAAVEMMKPFMVLFDACLDGDHPYGEYISDNNATEEADGTKTATCEFCGATDTITDEGTKLVPEKETISIFELIFTLITEFFAKIFSIFK